MPVAMEASAPAEQGMMTMASTGALPEAMTAPMSLLGKYSIFLAGVPVRSGASFFVVARDDVKFGGEQAEAGVGGDEVDALDTGLGVEQAQDGLRVDGAARAGDADHDLGSSSFRHGYSRINQSRWAVSAKSRRWRRIALGYLVIHLMTPLS